MMKKLSLITVSTLLLFSLAACATENKTETKEIKKIEKVISKSDSLEVKKGELTKVGQWTNSDDFGKLKLLKINNSPSTIKLSDGLSTTVDNIKVFHSDKISESMKLYLGTESGHGNFVQISSKVINDTNNEYDNIYPNMLVLSDGTQIEHSHSFDRNIGVKPNSKNEDLLFMYYIGDKIPDSITLYFDQITDSDGYGIEEIKASQKIDLK